MSKTLKLEINKSDVMPYKSDSKKDQKFGLYHIENPVEVDLSKQYEIEYKQMVTATNYVDDKILETITNVAKENGISSVYVVDKSAILETFKKAEKYDEITLNSSEFYVLGLKETLKPIEELTKERDEALNRIKELQKENKVLRDGVKVYMEYDVSNFTKLKNGHYYFSDFEEYSTYETNDDETAKLKAMLEVVEE